MTDFVRVLNEAGIGLFREYLQRARNGSAESPPGELLFDERYSEEASINVKVVNEGFANRYDFGVYLATILTPFDRRKISRNHALWNWLALYFFDVICKPSADGRRTLLREELYVLDKNFDYQRYYKHLVRTPWLAVLDHGESAKVLFLTTRGVRSDIEETLVASQQVLGNPTIIEAAYKLYFDPASQKPKRGAAGKSAGSPRRLTAVIQQLALTYDIQVCSSDQFVSMLPVEFNRFIPSLQQAA